jgi:uncharacterized RDD family membrane protein YckC
MSTVSEAIVFQFRCPKCFTALNASTDQVGDPFVCPQCGVDSEVIPEATESRIAAGQSGPAPMLGTGAAASAPAASKEFAFDDDYQKAFEQFQNEFGFTVSPFVRLGARLIDGFCMTVVIIIGALLASVFAGMTADGSGGEPSTAELILFLSVFFFPALCLAMYQWAWTASEGKTIGKKLLGIRIASKSSDGPPGFFFGVFMRTWVNSFLASLIPFYGLVDVLFIFGEEGRCLHDRLAGTIVLTGDPPQQPAKESAC